jgi:micrococcal nuclease
MPTNPPYAARRGMGAPAKVLLALAALLGTGMIGTVAVAVALAPAPSPTSAAPTRATAALSSAAGAASAPAATPTATATPPATRTSPRPTTLPRTSTATAAPKKAPAAAVAGLVAVTGVVDGDTIKVRLAGVTERVRVIGIDTPELASRECYAQQAASKMQSLVQSKQVRLVADPTQDDRDRYGRLLRHVRLADGRSVAQLLIAGGFGREYTYDRPYAGRDSHLEAQRAAQAADRGIWSSGCLSAVAPAPVAPAPSASPPAAGSGACTIKGNISSEGEKIYHVPGGAFYEQTKISTAKGERWFCSESDAVAAGWRPSQR